MHNQCFGNKYNRGGQSRQRFSYDSGPKNHDRITFVIVSESQTLTVPNVQGRDLLKVSGEGGQDQISQNYPVAVNSFKEALQLLDEANHQEDCCQLSRTLALENVQKALKEADLADRRLHDAEIHVGRIMHIIRKSGFKLPHVAPVPSRALVRINGVFQVPNAAQSSGQGQLKIYDYVHIMAPSTAAAAKGSKRGTSTQDPPVGRGKKAAKNGQAADAPTTLGLETLEFSASENGGNKENTIAASRPLRSNAGKGGHRVQLEKALNRIRPDLNSDDEQGTHRGNATFPEQTSDNEFAPPLPKRRRQAPRKGPAPRKTRADEGPQLRRPAVPDQPLRGPPAPSLQLTLPGSQFGFSATPGNDGPTAQVQSRQVAARLNNNGLQVTPAPMQLSTGRTSEHPTMPQEPSVPLVSNANPNQPIASDAATTARYARFQYTVPTAIGRGAIKGFNNRQNSNHSNNNRPNYNNHLNYNNCHDRSDHSNYNDPHDRQNYSDYHDQQDYDDDDDFYDYSRDANHSNNRNMIQNSPPMVDRSSNASNSGNGHVGPTAGTDDDRDMIAEDNSNGTDDKDFDGQDVDDDDGNGPDGDELLKGDIDEASPSEDEAVAVAALRGPRLGSPRDDVPRQLSPDRHGTEQANASDVEDVLQAHRLRNRAQRPPNPERLRGATSRNASDPPEFSSSLSENEKEDTEEQSADMPASKQRAPRYSKKPISNADPENLSFYSEEWVSVLVQAQQYWQRHLIIGRPDPFPEREHHLGEARKILTNVISESLNDGQLLDDTYTHTRKMDICISGFSVFAEHSTWRGELKTVAVPIVAAKYAEHLDVPDDFSGGQMEAHEIIMRNVKTLLKDSSFHIYGRDDQGHTNNIAHPAIQKIVIDFFYSGEKCLAALFPEHFSHRVPENAIGLVLTVIQNCLEEWTHFGYTRMNVALRGSTYLPVFTSMMTAIDNIKANPYHCAKFEANRAKWARMGMYELLKIKFGVHIADFLLTGLIFENPMNLCRAMVLRLFSTNSTYRWQSAAGVYGSTQIILRV
ncbi:hypothetical protein BDZ97DRAFT_1753911 [Flammula alnicola]|nr:hypothetical protein BDZ97DRAFT_1753911 [Flammula alnicola]